RSSSSRSTSSPRSCCFRRSPRERAPRRQCRLRATGALRSYRILLCRPTRPYARSLWIGSLYCPRMDVLEIAPGLWRWTAYHDEWKEDVGSTYCETTDGVVLVDPLVPHADQDRFWRSLD